MVREAFEALAVGDGNLMASRIDNSVADLDMVVVEELSGDDVSRCGVMFGSEAAGFIAGPVAGVTISADAADAVSVEGKVVGDLIITRTEAYRVYLYITFFSAGRSKLMVGNGIIINNIN